VGVVAAAGAWYRSPSALQAWLDWLAPKAAGILRGATHATLLVGLAAGALRLFNPVLLHTILTNLQATPVLTPIGEFALLLGGLNFFFGSYELPGWGQTRPW